MAEEIYYPRVQSIYRHYKGGTYRVITLAHHTETNEILVIYESLQFGSSHARPLANWNETVEVDKGIITDRFVLIE